MNKELSFDDISGFENVNSEDIPTYDETKGEQSYTQEMLLFITKHKYEIALAILLLLQRKSRSQKELASFYKKHIAESVLLGHWLASYIHDATTSVLKIDHIRIANIANRMAARAILVRREEIDQRVLMSDLHRTLQTEIFRGYNEVVVASSKSTDVFVWNATLDKRTCSICKSLDQKEFTKNEVPDCPAHPRCRCYLVKK